MVSRRPMSIYRSFLFDNAEAALMGPRSVAVGVDFWGHPNLHLRREPVPMASGLVRTVVAYANLADAEQSRAILREATFDARAARLSVRAAFADNRTPPMQRPLLRVRYAWGDVVCLGVALRSLEDLCVPLAVPADTKPDETYTLGIWRPDGTSLQVRWRVGTPGQFELLTPRFDSIWEQMTNLLQSSEPVVPEEAWPLDVAPEYERASDDDKLCAGHDEEGCDT